MRPCRAASTPIRPCLGGRQPEPVGRRGIGGLHRDGHAAAAGHRPGTWSSRSTAATNRRSGARWQRPGDVQRRVRRCRHPHCWGVLSGRGCLLGQHGGAGFPDGQSRRRRPSRSCRTRLARRPREGDEIEFTATVAVTAPGGGTPTGTVQFTDDQGADLGAPVDVSGNGVAKLKTKACSRALTRSPPSTPGDSELRASSGSVATGRRAAARQRPHRHGRDLQHQRGHSPHDGSRRGGPGQRQ